MRMKNGLRLPMTTSMLMVALSSILQCRSALAAGTLMESSDCLGCDNDQTQLLQVASSQVSMGVSGAGSTEKTRLQGQSDSPPHTNEGMIRGDTTSNLLQRDPSTTISSPPHFADADCNHLRQWRPSESHSCKVMPRVLIFTWCTEDHLTKLMNEVYWKSCYAKTHGFDVEFTGTKNVTGLPVFNDSGAGSSDPLPWYSDENMWSYLTQLRGHLTSGKYDYVFFVGSDVLFLQPHLDFPLWLYDGGHDLTIMDQGSDKDNIWGFNANGLLLKASAWSVNFLDVLYEHRHVFNLQGDNGPYMETILTHLGLEQAAKGHRGYEQTCHSLLVLDKPASYYVASNGGEYASMNAKYSLCFFAELDRLAGPFGQRVSEHIGFTKTESNGTAMLPWANCWSDVREHHPDWPSKCLAAHFNGLPKPNGAVVEGKCPDPTFDWDSSPYNVQNPVRPTY